jgi:phosphate transport system substrate-binding protein
MKNNTKFFLVVLAVSVIMLQGCEQSSSGKRFDTNDTYTKGKVSFVADESFAPVLDQEMYVFRMLNKEAKPVVLYKTENDAMRLFLNDSVRVAIIARTLKPDELKILRSRALYPEINCFAYDAVTLIVNQASNDTLTTVSEIKNMLNGKTKMDRNIVFDNAGSSITRYLKDFSGNQKLDQKNLFALKSNVEVIKYVSEHPEAVGFISYTWMLEPDKDYAPLVGKIKVVSVKDEGSKQYPDQYFKPAQNTLSMQKYPLMRGLYIINSTGRHGLGTGFASYLLGDGGQRLILRSGLLPDSIPTREISFSKQ